MAVSPSELFRRQASEQAERQAILDFVKVPAAEKIRLLWDAIQFLHTLRPPTTPSNEPGAPATATRDSTRGQIAE
ncbi:MAG: hypothetical protein HZA51_05965 [Planctomycetes bacterium]|nr:hypothetical protein [Planctomycetota bacterium]